MQQPMVRDPRIWLHVSEDMVMQAQPIVDMCRLNVSIAVPSGVFAQRCQFSIIVCCTHPCLVISDTVQLCQGCKGQIQDFVEGCGESPFVKDCRG